MEKIKKEKISIFAEFRNKEDYNSCYNQVLTKLPKSSHFDLFVLMGRLEQTIKNGFSDE
jgi:hypothetical protein